LITFFIVSLCPRFFVRILEVDANLTGPEPEVNWPGDCEINKVCVSGSTENILEILSERTIIEISDKLYAQQ